MTVGIRCLRAKPEAGAGRWRVRDVIVFSAGLLPSVTVTRSFFGVTAFCLK